MRLVGVKSTYHPAVALADDDAALLTTFRLSDAARCELKALLRGQLTEDLFKSLSHCVGVTRWQLATERCNLKPREMESTKRHLKNLTAAATQLRDSLRTDGYAAWLLRDTLAKKSLPGDWVEPLIKYLDQLAEIAEAASARAGVLTIEERYDFDSARWISDAQYRITGLPGRPSESPRRGLAFFCAYALARTGIRVTKTRGGLFDKVLRILLREADLFIPSDLSRTISPEVDRVRGLLGSATS
jgi:hypothetical protein